MYAITTRCLPWCIVTAVALAACTTPAARYDARANAFGFSALVLEGDGFHHRAYAAGGRDPADALHVYIEHDGTPWSEPTRVSNDPTPRRPVALELMARDGSPRLLLGRPCYFELRDEPRCNLLLWTHRRYSSEVIGSMVAALRTYLAMHPTREVVLIGYSGGGTIAWLMAARMPEVSTVVTIAANLDIEQWARIHDYSPLSGSQNPATAAPLPKAVHELHFYGGRDANVTPAIVASFLRRHPRAKGIEIAEFDHECCWIERWPALLPTIVYVTPVAGAF